MYKAHLPLDCVYEKKSNALCCVLCDKGGQVIAGAMGVLDTIGQTIIKDKDVDANSTSFMFNEVTLLLGKEHGHSLEGQEFQSKHGGIRLPRRLESLNIDGGSCVERQVSHGCHISLDVAFKGTIWNRNVCSQSSSAK